jgi:hypothetical protein
MRRVILIILNIFLAITSISGGIGLLTGTISPPAEYLNGTIFRTYLIPGLALLILVGGIALSCCYISLYEISIFKIHFNRVGIYNYYIRNSRNNYGWIS